VAEVLGFCHKERVEAVDSFELEMEIFSLLYGCFQIQCNNSIQVFEFSEELEHTLMADFSHSYLYAPQIEDHLTK